MIRTGLTLLLFLVASVVLAQDDVIVPDRVVNLKEGKGALVRTESGELIQFTCQANAKPARKFGESSDCVCIPDIQTNVHVGYFLKRNGRHLTYGNTLNECLAKIEEFIRVRTCKP